MITISGCPRSGTSLMMQCLAAALGDARIMGDAFPMAPKATPKIDDRLQAISAHIQAKGAPARAQRMGHARDMNPGGFYECAYSVRGIRYNFTQEAEQARLLSEPSERRTVVKIVSQGLANSDPRFVDRIIYMMRPPREVAKSQEKLSGQFRDPQHVIHSPEMFIRVTAMAARWLMAHSDIPLLLVDYHDLLTEPIRVFDSLYHFLGEGDFARASGIIDPALYRSKAENVPNDLWGDADKVYELFRLGRYSEVVSYMSRPEIKTNRAARSWPCVRMGQTVTDKQCAACKSNPVVRENFKKWAERMKIDWRKEPCSFECGFDLEREPVGVEKSIAENFWITDVQAGG